MKQQLTILLVEDDKALAMGTEYSLQDEDIDVLCVDSFSELKEIYPQNKDKFDCALLDVMLPDSDGYQICKWLKEQDVLLPVIFLTALADEGNIVHGLDIGGDDYITKPFHIKELVARIHANVRKSKQLQQTPQVMISKNIKLDRENFCVWKNCQRLELTLSEFRLLSELMTHTGQVMTREQLMERLWSVDEAFVDDNTLSVYIRRLREKLDTQNQQSFIKTIRGVGYVWKGET